MRILIKLVLAAVAVALVGATTATAQPAPHTLLWAVGDAQAEDVNIQNQVADLIGSQPPAKLLFLGDFSNGGSPEEYANLYGPSYGRFKGITAPTIGNHDWAKHVTGYDAYWGPGFLQPDGGHWYSFDIGGWHLISVSSMDDKAPSSPQLNWLRQDIAAHPGTCTLAFTHYPRYSAGPQFNTISMEPIWATLANHAVLYISGHAHNYQRLQPVRGITQFVVGTGGGPLGNTDDFDPRLAAKNDHIRGALRIELNTGGARLSFVDVAGQTLDQSDVACRPSTPTPAAVRMTRPRGANVRYPVVKQLIGSVDNAERIRLTLLRRVGSRCYAFDGERFLARSCKTKLSFPLDDEITPATFPGTGTSRFRWKVPDGAALPSGSYRVDVRVRAIDNSTAVGSTRFLVGKKR